MAPYRILTDSTTDLSPALVEKMNVTVLSLMFTMDGKTYRNTPDEADMPSKVFYDKVRAGSMPTTSQITPMDFKEAVGPILAGGEDVLYLAFSSGLSGTYNNSRIAFAELAEEYPQRKVICCGTLGASMGEGLACLSGLPSSATRAKALKKWHSGWRKTACVLPIGSQ